MTCAGIFGPSGFGDNGLSKQGGSDEEVEVYGRTDRLRFHKWLFNPGYPPSTSQQSHCAPQHVVIGVDVGGGHSDVPVTHQPHENPNAGAFGRKCCGETAATAVATGSFDPGPRVKSQEELGQCVGSESPLRTLLGVEQGRVGIVGRYRCKIGGDLLAKPGTDKHSAGITPFGLVG